MHMSRKSVVAAIVVVGCVGTGGAALAMAGSSGRSVGPEFVYGDTGELVDATAAVHVVTTGAGGSVITLHVRGVAADAGRTFGAHIHQKPCDSEDPLAAGGHYQHAPTGDLEAREVWLDVTVNAAGNGHAVARRPWQVDESTPRSVIIHADPTAHDGTAGPRLACIDLDGRA